MTISAEWKVSEQCGIAARKENQLLGMIKINITYTEKNLIIPLYKSIVSLETSSDEKYRYVRKSTAQSNKTNPGTKNYQL